jgi:hypothetical protein
MKIEKRGRLIALAISVLAILTLGAMSAPAILAISVGTLLVALGVTISFRAAAVFGFMTLAIGSGMAVEVESFTEVSSLTSAVLGILVPVYILAWVALSSEIEEPVEIDVKSRSTVITVVFTVLCTFSVPIVALLVGFIAPQISTHITLITEAAIMLLAIAISVVILTAKNPRTTASELPEIEPVPEQAQSQPPAA